MTKKESLELSPMKAWIFQASSPEADSFFSDMAFLFNVS
jgi:hypothetical protein